jgi:hypothetical protein
MVTQHYMDTCSDCTGEARAGAASHCRKSAPFLIIGQWLRLANHVHGRLWRIQALFTFHTPAVAMAVMNVDILESCLFQKSESLMFAIIFQIAGV